MSLQQSQKHHVEEMEEMGRKFLIEKSEMGREMEKEKERIRQEARVQAEQGLHARTRAIWADNKR